MVRLFRVMALIGLFVLTACAAQPATQPTLAPEPTAAQVPATAPVPTATQSVSVAATDAPTSVAASVPAEASAIPMGKTPEGYNYLGNPNAPVTITFYSDFF